MTKRLPVSGLENVWYDSQQVGAQDLQTEQEHNDQLQAAGINNHFGSGILQGVLAQPVILDTDTTVGLIDGKPILPTNEPSDANNGVQLEIELMDSTVFGACNAFGRRQIKVCVIGLDFNQNLQYDTFYFSKIGKAVTSKHYTNILSVLFNDMRGAAARSLNLGGRVVVREAAPFSLSTDTVMVAQDQEPNLFFRDFAIDSTYVTLAAMLAAAVPGYTVDGLSIATQPKQSRKILRSDVTTQLGEKFQATTNNIQKISLLLLVEKNLTAPADINLNWTGDLVLSVYSLQSTTVVPGAIMPTLAIDFDPSNLPLAQASVNFSTLQANGTTLDGYFQPVDFIFSNTPVANGGLIPGNFYAFTLKRSGSSDKCNIVVPIGSPRLTNSRVTIFNGTNWTDIQEENLWFRIYTDAAKVTDGQAYDAGQGIVLPKIGTDPLTGAAIDNALKGAQFTTTQPFYAVIQAALAQSTIVQDQRTGDNIFSRKQFSPKLNLLSANDLATLKLTTEPVVIGLIQDRNIKAFDAANSIVSSSFSHFGFYKNEVIIKIIDTNGDPNNNLNLVTSLQNGDMVDATFVPNTANPGITYRIAKAELLTMNYGDVGGDGLVDDTDAVASGTYLNKTLQSSPNSVDYFTSTNPFALASVVTFNIVDSNTLISAVFGTCTLIPSTTDGSFASISNPVFVYGDFTTVTSNPLITFKFVIAAPGNGAVPPQNFGSFNITSVTSSILCTINKFMMTSDSIMKILRSDIGANYLVDSTDIINITNYALRVPPANPIAAKVGKNFRVLKLRLESSIDRSDDYVQTLTGRPTVLHPIQDIVVNDPTLASHNYVSSTVPFNIIKHLTWKSDLVTVTRSNKFVPASFTYNSSTPAAACSNVGIVIASYPTPALVDAGRNDFYVPNNLVIGNQIVNPDGSGYRNDMEVGTIVLQIPTKIFLAETSINVFTNFVADTSGFGTTAVGYTCMRFADCSTVSPNAVINNQVRFSASIQSFYSDINGLSVDGYSGVIIDPKMGLSIDYTTGIMKLNFSHLLQDPVIQTLNTKIQVMVFLKKAGFNNNYLFVDSSKLANILGL